MSDAAVPTFSMAERDRRWNPARASTLTFFRRGLFLPERVLPERRDPRVLRNQSEIGFRPRVPNSCTGPGGRWFFARRL
jgi:hypothetical protein